MRMRVIALIWQRGTRLTLGTLLYWFYALRSIVSGCDLRLVESMEEEKQLELVYADTVYFR